jgi:hypothetical protein
LWKGVFKEISKKSNYSGDKMMKRTRYAGSQAAGYTGLGEILIFYPIYPAGASRSHTSCFLFDGKSK